MNNVIPLNTIIYTVGPSNCGKSNFCKNFLLPKFTKAGFKVKYLSSDDIRRELLGEHDMHKMDPRMYAQSRLAFDQLWKSVDLHTQFPNNWDYVLIDSTGLNQNFHETVSEIAQRNNYNQHCILFDYKHQDYFKHVESGSKFVIDRHVKNFKTRLLPNLKKLNITKPTRVKDFEFENYIPEPDHAGKNFKDVCKIPDEPFIVIGDIHACFDEFIVLLKELKFNLVERDGSLFIDKPHQKIVLVGDVIDKGPKVKELLKFLLDNKNCFEFVYGNHENFVVKALQDKIPRNSDFEKVKVNFDSLELFENDSHARSMFFEYVELTKPFIFNSFCVVTHAPCLNKFLCKIDKNSLKQQRNFRYTREKEFDSEEEFQEHLDETFGFVKDEAEFNEPYHICGHVELSSALFEGNKLMIDTGCVSGHKLTSVEINGINKPYFKHVSSRQPIKDKKMFRLFAHKQKSVNLNNLDFKDFGRIKWSAEHKVNFVSGTMSPSDKDEDSLQIETLENALNYYDSQKINHLVLQPKYMGSRCNIYLFDEVEKSYATSRNGYVINYIDELPELFKSIRKKLSHLFEKDVEMILLDGELLPWMAMGKNLIEKNYKIYLESQKSHIELLKENNFSENFDALKEELKNTNFRQDFGKLTKKELNEKYPHHIIKKYKQMIDCENKIVPVEHRIKGLETFAKQLEIFGSDGEIEYKPFAILKKVHKDGSEVVFNEHSNHEIFSSISDDESLLIDLNDENARDLASSYWDKITNQENMEGVVVKPDHTFIPNVAPYLKVRNPRYLTLIYGSDYQYSNKIEKLVKRKRINKKMKISITEYWAGFELLKIKYQDIHLDNQDYVDRLARLILDEKSEIELDPRL